MCKVAGGKKSSIGGSLLRRRLTNWGAILADIPQIPGLLSANPRRANRKCARRIQMCPPYKGRPIEVLIWCVMSGLRSVSDETDDEGRGVPGMKQSHGFRTREASNPNDWLRTRLVALEFHCGVPRPKAVLMRGGESLPLMPKM
jgi:hypothetical protein